MEEDCITIMRGEIEDLNASISELCIALGLLTTLHPNMEINIDDPVEMAEKVVAHVNEELHNARLCARYETDVAGQAIEDMEKAKARVAELENTLTLYEDALEEAEAIFGGEYADSYGAMFKLAMEARDARAAMERSYD